MPSKMLLRDAITSSSFLSFTPVLSLISINPYSSTVMKGKVNLVFPFTDHGSQLKNRFSVGKQWLRFTPGRAFFSCESLGKNMHKVPSLRPATLCRQEGWGRERMGVERDDDRKIEGNQASTTL